jgi:hypothetical protein
MKGVIECEIVERIHKPVDVEWWRAFVNTIVKLPVS